MAIELKQQLKLSQQLVMTPQLQQAIKLLQLNQLELVNLVQAELQENPVLEENELEDETPGERDDATLDAGADGSSSDGSDERDGLSAQESVDDFSAGGERDESAGIPELGDLAFDAPASAADGATSDFEEATPSDADKIADVEWEAYLESNPMTGLDSKNTGDEERPSLEATYTRRQSLAEHLTWQLQVTELDPAELEIAGWIVGNLDEQGYLRATIEEIANESGALPAAVEKVLRVVQSLDPTGVAARDLRECLLLQLDRLGAGDCLARRIVDEHLDQLQKRDFRGLTRVMGVTIQEVADATRVIAALEPRPGRGFGGEDPVYITPDIYVYKIGDDFHVLLNEDGLPKLRISSVYRDMLSSGSRGDGQKDTRAYVHEKVRSAMWLIKSIHQRQRTIYKVMQSIIQHQRDFFEHGVAHSQAPEPARRRRRHRDARVDRLARHDQQIRPYATGHLRAQILLQLEHQSLRRRGTRLRVGEGEDPQDHRERGPRPADVGPADRRDAEGGEHRHRPADGHQISRGDEHPLVDSTPGGLLRS